MSIVVKISINSDEIRRFSLPSKTLNWKQFWESLSSMIPLTAGSQIKYKDEEGDFITMSNDSDLAEGLRVFTTSGAPIWRLFLTTAKPEEPKKPAASPEASGPANLFNFISEQLARPEVKETLANLRDAFAHSGAAPGAPFAHPAICDACEKRIVGIRWKCTDLENTDLCDACMTKGEHPLVKHNYVKIERPFWCPPRGRCPFKKPEADAAKPAGSAEAPRPRCGRFRDAPSFICDACDKKIEGIRWKCLDLENTDLCDACMTKGEHPLVKHDFAKVDSKPAWGGWGGHHKKWWGKWAECAKKFADAKAPAPAPVAVPKPDEAPKASAPVEAPKPSAPSIEVPVVKSEPVKAPVVEAPKPVAPVVADSADVKSSTSTFATKLQTLVSMGFTNPAQNIKALVETGGDITAAVQVLLGSF